MALAQYPVEIPVEAVKIVIDVVRDRTFRERAGDFGNAIWNVIGYAQSKVLVNNPTVLKMRSVSLNDDQALALLSTTTADGNAKSILEVLPWEQVLTWLLQKALEFYLHQYQVTE